MLGDTFGIGQLFALSRDPVICVRGGTVLSMNPPAVNLFGGDRTGCNAAQLLPETILSAESERFIAGTVVNGQNVTVSCGTWEDVRMYSFIIPASAENQTADRAISSSLRELTNTIKATTDQILVLSERYQDEKLSRYTAILKHSSCRLKRLIMNYSLVDDCLRGIQAFSPVTASVNAVCRDMADMVSDLAAKRNIRVEFRDTEEIYASMDVVLIQQMLLNLLCNSLQNAPENSTIRLSLSATDKFVSIMVADEGGGIAPEVLAELFRQYELPPDLHTGRFSAGLGLAVANSIAKLHDGAIIVNSTPGHGCVIAARIRRSTDRRMMSPREDYRSVLTDAVLTQLSPWLTWKDYLHTGD